MPSSILHRAELGLTSETSHRRGMSGLPYIDSRARQVTILGKGFAATPSRHFVRPVLTAKAAVDQPLETQAADVLSLEGHLGPTLKP